MFWAEIWISEFLSENIQFLVVKFSIYLNRRVFVMNCPYPFNICTKSESYCFSGFWGVVIKNNPFFKFNVAMETKQNGHWSWNAKKWVDNHQMIDHNCQIWYTSLHWLWRKCNSTIFPLCLWELSVANQTKRQITIILAIWIVLTQAAFVQN